MKYIKKKKNQNVILLKSVKKILTSILLMSLFAISIPVKPVIAKELDETEESESTEEIVDAEESESTEEIADAEELESTEKSDEN